MTFLLLGAAIGFVSGVTPGPVLTLVVSETLKGGWPRGAAVAAETLLADGPIIVLAVGLALALQRWIALVSQRVYRGLDLATNVILAV